MIYVPYFNRKSILSDCNAFISQNIPFLKGPNNHNLKISTLFCSLMKSECSQVIRIVKFGTQKANFPLNLRIGLDIVSENHL